MVIIRSNIIVIIVIFKLTLEFCSREKKKHGILNIIFIFAQLSWIKNSSLLYF